MVQRDRRRLLRWRFWGVLSEAAQARMRWLMMQELRHLDVYGSDGGNAWRQTHRQLLALKAASAHGEAQGA